MNKMTSGLGDTGFSSFSVYGKQASSAPLYHIFVIITLFARVLGETCTSSPKFSDAFVVSETDDFFGEVSKWLRWLTRCL